MNRNVENSENAIEIRDLTKYFKIQHDGAHTLRDKFLRGRKKSNIHVVLENINLDIKKGETVALIGTNGSGKSTLLKLISKIIRPNKGTIKTNGKLTSLLELGAGFHPDFTGRENIYFNAAIFGLNRQEIDGRINEIIDFSELGEAIDQPIRTYSSGMYMRLAFSVAINVDAEILLIDEILAVGDQHFQGKCFAKLRELKKSGKTIVIVSHSLDVTNSLCERTIWICDKHIRMDGDSSFVTSTYLDYLDGEHSLDRKNAVKEGKLKATGIINFDNPRTNSIFTVNDTITITGWKICDLEKAKFILSVNGIELDNINYSRRKDVEKIYREDFGGLYNQDEVGFNRDFLAKDYLSGRGSLLIEAKLLDDNDNSINETSILVIIEDE